MDQGTHVEDTFDEAKLERMVSDQRHQQYPDDMLTPNGLATYGQIRALPISRNPWTTADGEFGYVGLGSLHRIYHQIKAEHDALCHAVAAIAAWQFGHAIFDGEGNPIFDPSQDFTGVDDAELTDEQKMALYAASEADLDHYLGHIERDRKMLAAITWVVDERNQAVIEDFVSGNSFDQIRSLFAPDGPLAQTAEPQE